MWILGHLHKQSVRFITCLFIAALFADAANVPDIFASPNIIIAHEDGDAEASQFLSQNCSSLPIPSHVHVLDPVSTGRNASHVIYDEDSPSLQAGFASDCVAIHALSTESVVALLDPLVIEELYLRNSSLLI